MKLPRFRWSGQTLFAAVLLSLTSSAYAAAPTVSNVRASQRAGTQLVDIYSDVVDVDSPTLSVSVAVSTNGEASYFSPAASLGRAKTERQL